MALDIVGGALKVGGTLFGGLFSAFRRRRIKKRIREQLRENQRWYDQRYNEDATQRADAQRLLTMTNEAIRNRNKAAQATAAVMGGTTEGVAATQDAQAQMLGNTIGNINERAEQRKDAVESTYMNRRDTLNDKLNNYDSQQAQNIQQAAQAVGDAGAQMLGIPAN